MNPVILTLDADQVGQNPITLTTAELASIDAQRSSQVPPQPPQPPTTGPVPPYVNPQPSRTPIVVKMPWTPATRIYSGVKLDDHNIWLIPFTTGAFSSGTFAGGEWIDQPTFRNYQVIRNRDGTVIFNGHPAQTPSFNFTSAAPPPHSGLVQLDHNEQYTLAIWNEVTATGSGRMFMELQYR